MNDSEHKAMPSPQGNQLSKDRRQGPLKCIRECVMPGLGEFHVGDIIDSGELYTKLADHPYFTTTIEEK